MTEPRPTKQDEAALRAEIADLRARVRVLETFADRLSRMFAQLGAHGSRQSAAADAVLQKWIDQQTAKHGERKQRKRRPKGDAGDS